MAEVFSWIRGELTPGISGMLQVTVIEALSWAKATPVMSSMPHTHDEITILFFMANPPCARLVFKAPPLH